MTPEKLRQNAEHCGRQAASAKDDLQRLRDMRAARAWQSLADRKKNLDESLTQSDDIAAKSAASAAAKLQLDSAGVSTRRSADPHERGRTKWGALAPLALKANAVDGQQSPEIGLLGSAFHNVSVRNALSTEFMRVRGRGFRG